MDNKKVEDNFNIIDKKITELTNKGEYKKALNYLDEIENKDKEIIIPFNINRAELYYNLKDYSKALEVCEKGIKTNFMPYRFWEIKSRIFEELEEFEKAIESRREQWYGWPGNLDDVADAWVYDCDKLIEKDPKNLEAYYKKAEACVYARMGIAPHPVEVFEKLIEISPNNTDFIKEVIDRFENTEFFSDDNLGQEAIGFLHAKIGEYEKAVECFEKYYEDDWFGEPFDKFWLLKIDCLKKLKKYDEALENCKKALGLFKGNKEIIKEKQQIENILSKSK